MERMDGAINAREAELKEVIKINNEDIAYLNNRVKNAETELDQVKRYNKELEEENKKLDEAYQIVRDRVIELLGDIELYLGHIKELEEENKKLKEERDLYKARNEELNEDCFGLANENKKLKEELKELEETLEHRDSILSIMYDLLRSDLSDYEQLSMIDVVIDVEVGNEPQNKLREELLDRFWKRDF